jgi:thiol-disulfide isomerase/thioredoxin
MGLIFVVQPAGAQSLGDLARQQREQRAKGQDVVTTVDSDDLLSGRHVGGQLDPARKGDLDYLLGLLSRPNPSPELLGAFVPLKERAIPRLLPLLTSGEGLKCLAPATVLIVLGKSEGLGAAARALQEVTGTANAVGASGETTSGQGLGRTLEAARKSNLATAAVGLGIWRFTEGRTKGPEEVVQRLAKGPEIKIVSRAGNTAEIFNRALRDDDPNLRLAAAVYTRATTGGNDFGYQVDKPAEQNAAAIPRMVSALLPPLPPDLLPPGPATTLDDEGLIRLREQCRGRVLLIEEFQVTCPWCQAQVEIMSKLYKNYRDQGLSVIALSFDDAENRTRVPDFLNAKAAAFGGYLDNIQYVDAYGDPTYTSDGTFKNEHIVRLYDTHGKLVRSWPRTEVHYEVFENAVRQYLP